MKCHGLNIMCYYRIRIAGFVKNEKRFLFKYGRVRAFDCSLEILSHRNNLILKKITCVISTYLDIYAQGDYIENKCLPQCPLECNSTQITFTTTSYDLLGDIYVDYIQKNMNLSSDFVTTPIDTETSRQSIVKLNIYYDTLSYTQSEDFPQWDITSLIASIGGNLGLFLGVCMFSFVEMLTTLFQLYFYKKTNINNKINA